MWKNFSNTNHWSSSLQTLLHHWLIRPKSILWKGRVQENLNVPIPAQDAIPAQDWGHLVRHKKSLTNKNLTSEAFWTWIYSAVKPEVALCKTWCQLDHCLVLFVTSLFVISGIFKGISYNTLDRELTSALCVSGVVDERHGWNDIDQQAWLWQLGVKSSITKQCIDIIE